MARQPIFDRNRKLYGFELLFRNQRQQAVGAVGGDKATSQVVVNLCTSISGQFAAFNQPLFINITREFLLSEAFFPIEPEAVVMELLEETDVDDDVRQAMVAWRKKGFRFALDDYLFESKFDILLPLVDFVKVELLEYPLEETLGKLDRLQNFDFQLVAEKVESQDVFKRCMEAGFDLFQGYFLAQPDQVYGTAVAPSYQGLMQVLSLVQSEDASIEELSRSVSNEPRLVYQLLRILNSPACRLHRKIENIKEALVYLGLAQLKKWTLLILFTSSKDIELELVRILLTRARTCELYASLKRLNNPENFFMTGLLSGVDLLLKTKRESVFEQINLSDEIRLAIMEFKGPAGNTLKLVTDIEKGSWDAVNALDLADYRNLFSAFNEAGLWAHETLEIVYET